MALLLPWCLMLCISHAHGLEQDVHQGPGSATADRHAAGATVGVMPCHGDSPMPAQHLESDNRDDPSDCPNCDAQPDSAGWAQLPTMVLEHTFGLPDWFSALAYRASSPVGPDPPPSVVPIYLLHEVFLI